MTLAHIRAFLYLECVCQRGKMKASKVAFVWKFFSCRNLEMMRYKMLGVDILSPVTASHYGYNGYYFSFIASWMLCGCVSVTL